MMLKLSSNKNYFLLIIPIILAIMALRGFGFLFKSGTALSGILILGFLYFKKLKNSLDVWMIIGAFLFSIAGDWFLSNMKGDTGMFVTGIAMFFVAHVGYLSFALLNGKIKWPFTGILLAAYLVFFFLKLFPYLDNSVLMAAVLIYLLISCLSLGAAVGINARPVVRWSYVFGITMILFSDTIISFKEFVGYSDLNYLILPTYYLAHISIIFSLLKKVDSL